MTVARAREALARPGPASWTVGGQSTKHNHGRGGDSAITLPRLFRDQPMMNGVTQGLSLSFLRSRQFARIRSSPPGRTRAIRAVPRSARGRWGPCPDGTRGVGPDGGPQRGPRADGGRADHGGRFRDTGFLQRGHPAALRLDDRSRPSGRADRLRLRAPQPARNNSEDIRQEEGRGGSREQGRLGERRVKRWGLAHPNWPGWRGRGIMGPV